MKKSIIKNQWVIYHPNKYPIIWTIARTKKDSIKNFIEDTNFTWKECLKIGWTIGKATVTIEPND